MLFTFQGEEKQCVSSAPGCIDKMIHLCILDDIQLSLPANIANRAPQTTDALADTQFIAARFAHMKEALMRSDTTGFHRLFSCFDIRVKELIGAS